MKESSLSRRRFVSFLAVGGLTSLSGCSGLINPCRRADPPKDLMKHPMVQEAWRGVDPAQMWDVHVHLTGTGDSGKGLWLHPSSQQRHHPMRYLATKFFMNGGCVDPKQVDQSYVRRLHALMEAFPSGAKAMLLAFDYAYNESRQLQQEKSHFYTSNSYAAEMAQRYPERFEWIASIHPWRSDAIPALERAAANGAKAVKWLPPSQGIDPANPRCVPFYKALARLELPLLCHTGEEKAVISHSPEDWGEPKRLKLALKHDVKVILAHCATTGHDQNGHPYFDQFIQMMERPAYEGLLFGDISAVVLRNRTKLEIQTLLERTEWHQRMLYGSDYPLPGIVPLISLSRLQGFGFLQASQIEPLRLLREHNPMLFSFVLTRVLRHEGTGFSDQAFHTRKLFP
ncbi:MAG: amidohydrolase family protein [Magnetococcales bacterium]|nr:amidohydrolase family protein [Magnetococcales bacterium]